jgi:leucyl aminopeptidase
MVSTSAFKVKLRRYNVATLTGAQMVATGRRFAGVLSDDEGMEARPRHSFSH